MDERAASFFILVPGPWHDAKQVSRALLDRGVSNALDGRAAAQPGSFNVEVVDADEDDLRCTCGMHHFDLPDAEVKLQDREEAGAWLDAFCLYQLIEQPALLSGHTFRPHANSERRAFERWPDQHHHRDDGRH